MLANTMIKTSESKISPHSFIFIKITIFLIEDILVKIYNCNLRRCP